ncbi:MAG: hypothetical protein ACKOPO_00710, partial [Novosphingobium sp.]
MISPRGRKAVGALAASAAIGGLVAVSGHLCRSGNRSAKTPEKDGETRRDSKSAMTGADLPDPRFGPGETAEEPQARASAHRKQAKPAPAASMREGRARPATTPSLTEPQGPTFRAAFSDLGSAQPAVAPAPGLPAARPAAAAERAPAIEASPTPPLEQTLAAADASSPAAPAPGALLAPADPAAALHLGEGPAPASQVLTEGSAAALPVQPGAPAPAGDVPASAPVAGPVVAAPLAQAGPEPRLAAPPPPVPPPQAPEKRGARRMIARPQAPLAVDPKTAPAFAAQPVAQPSAEQTGPAPARPALVAKANAPLPAVPAARPGPAMPSARNLPVPKFGTVKQPASIPASKPAGTAGLAPPPPGASEAKSLAFATAALGKSIAPSADPALAQAGLLGLGSGLAGAGDFGPAMVVSSDDELIIELRTPDGEIRETITAYGTREGVFLPLGEVARLLDLAIAVSDEGRYASGWVLDQKAAVAINLRAGTVALAGKDVPLSPRDAVAMDGEMFLKAERFAQIMPLTMKVDLRAQTVVVTTLQPFPFQQRLARESERERLSGRAARPDGPSYDREPTPWQIASFPVADVELRTLSDSTRGTRGEADLRLAGDIGFMTGQGFVSASSTEGLIAARLELGRRDPDARLLGPLRASEFQIGDVATISMPLGLRGIGGRGAMITNAPLERASVFDRIDLRGELADGYEVELYRNNTLIGSTATPVNGQFAFQQVPVEFGLNVFRLVFYGPQGQRREEVRRISVGDGRLAQGQLVYSFGMAQKDVNLFDVRPPDFIPGQDFGSWRAVGQIEYGVSANLTAVAGGAWYQRLGHSHWLANAGLRTGVGPLAAQLDLGLNDAGGKALEVQLGGSLGGMSVTAAHAEYIGQFSDELRAFSIEPLRRATEANLIATAHFGPA